MYSHLRGLHILCSLAAVGLAPAGAAVTRKSGSTGTRIKASSAATSKWGPEDLGLGAAGDLPVPRFSDTQSSSMISVPGEGMVEDEMVALQHPSPERFPPSPSWSPTMSTGSSAKLMAALATAQSQGVMSGAVLDTKAVETPKPVPIAAAPEQKAQYVDEYDVKPDDEDNEDDDYRTVKMTETSTKEELERQEMGDVEHVQPKPAKPRPLLRKFKVAAAVEEGAHVAIKSSKSEAVEAAEQPAGGDKMMAQCMAFASWVKGQGTTGPDLVRIWKGTCMPAVMAGSAPPNYNNMCSALGTTVGKFAVRPWAPADLCQAVLAVFRESGVGSTPLAG